MIKIAEYSDYAIHSIEYFITAIEAGLVARDLAGLTYNKNTQKSRIEKINVLKEHPLVALMASQLAENRNADLIRANIIPAISVTPGNINDESPTIGQGYRTETVDTAFINDLKRFIPKTNKEIFEDVIISQSQIEQIIAAYKKANGLTIYAQIHKWQKKEEVNVGVWSDNADTDILLGNIMDSILASIVVGVAGDNSKIMNLMYRATKGLTNFNFGRVLFGTEYNLTFVNTYNNYTIYSEERISDHRLDGTFITVNEV